MDKFGKFHAFHRERRYTGRFGPLLIFILLTILTLLVWRQQVTLQHSLLIRHTEDVCVQMTRLLTSRVESRLRFANIFARRWATHETRDFSYKRFVDFASVLIQELPEYFMLHLFQDDSRPGWTFPADARTNWYDFPSQKRQSLLKASQLARGMILTVPASHKGSDEHVFVILPLLRDQESLGYMIVEFKTDQLIGHGISGRIRSEFNILISDGEIPLFIYDHDERTSFYTSPLRSEQKFTVGTRLWSISMVPQRRLITLASWGASLPIPIFGILLSIGLSWFVHLLLKRMELFREAMQRQVSLAQKALVAQEEERARVSRELHDELGQLLTAIHLELDLLVKRAKSVSNQDPDVFEPSIKLVEKAADELRRICRGLRPPLLDDLGLEPAVRLLIEEFEERSKLKIRSEIQLKSSEHLIVPEIALCVYRILQESLNNVYRHANAREVKISITTNGHHLFLAVYDNGQGFDLTLTHKGEGCGLAGMRERANLINGTVEFHSAPNQGTQVLLQVPLQ